MKFCKILQDCLLSLSNLKELTLANNLFEGGIPSELNKLLKLETLLLNNNRFIGLSINVS